MNKQQYISGSIGKRTSKQPFENPLFSSSTKQEIFAAHFSKLNRTRNDSVKQSEITLSSEYENTFQSYMKKNSLIDRIVDTFDNGSIVDLSHEKPIFAHSQIYLHLPAKTKQSIQKINQLYFIEQKANQFSFQAPLTHQNYSKALSELKQPSFQFYQVTLTPLGGEALKPVMATRSETVATHNPHQTKVDLLLNEIYQEKKRNDSPLYIQDLQIKLGEFIDYILGDDDRYIGLSLQHKVNEIMKQINKFKGKVIDGWLALVLIQIFFQQFKEVQTYKASILRTLKKKSQLKHEIKSEMDAKSVKSNNSSMKKSKYSQPNSRRNVIQQQEWMGSLK